MGERVAVVEHGPNARLLPLVLLDHIGLQAATPGDYLGQDGVVPLEQSGHVGLEIIEQPGVEDHAILDHLAQAGAILPSVERSQRGRVDYLQMLTIEPGSNAEASGFLVGDIIFSINKQLTRNFEEMFALVESNEKGMVMNIKRGNRELYILLK